MKKITFLTIFIFTLSSQISIAQWIYMSSGMENLDVYTLASGGNNIFAGTSYGVYLSTNNGINWTQNSLNNEVVTFLAISGNYVYAGTYNDGIYLSTNSGLSWSQTSIGMLDEISGLAAGGNCAIAGFGLTMPPYGLFSTLTTNNGQTWTGAGLNGLIVGGLAVNGNYIFAGTIGNGNVYLSSNYGANWIQTSLNNVSVFCLAVTGSNVFAGTNNSGLYLSTNNGTNWNQTSLSSQWIYSIAISGNNVFAGTRGDGVCVSNNFALNWTERNEGLDDTIVGSLSLMNNYIFATTNTHGVWRRSLSELVGIKLISDRVPIHFYVTQNYPNPFNPTTKFKIEIAKSAETKIEIYDVLGRQVEKLVNEQLDPGTYEIEWNASKYSSGVYFYKVTSNDYVEMKKMILLK